MSWRVRTLISSGCKCILVQVGQLIYSSKCNSINLFLSVLSMHCTSLPGEKCGAGMPDFSMSFWSFSQNRGIGLFYLKCKTKKQRGCVNASYLIWKTWRWEAASDKEKSSCVPHAGVLAFILVGLFPVCTSHVCSSSAWNQALTVNQSSGLCVQVVCVCLLLVG